MPMTAQTATTDNLLNIAGLVPTIDGKTIYYLKNVGSGLFMSYGGEHGTHCIETQQAHPIILESNGDGTVAIASIGGYLESNTLWMDSTKYSADGVLVSKWHLESVDGYTNQYYLYGADGERVLSSVGESSGLLALSRCADKAYQRWVFVTESEFRQNNMSKASEDYPIDATFLIKGAAFDYVDGWVPKNTPKYLHSLMPYEKLNWGETFVNNKMAFHASGSRNWDPAAYNYCANLTSGETALAIEYSMVLPKGLYRLSYEGFYLCRADETTKTQKWTYSIRGWYWKDVSSATVSDKPVDLSAYVEVVAGSLTEKDYFTRNDAVTFGDGTASAVVFRDNDDYEHGIEFYVGGEMVVTIRIKRDAISLEGSTNETGSGRTIISYSNIENQISFDNFCLYYSGAVADAPVLDAKAPFCFANKNELREYMRQVGASDWFEAGWNDFFGAYTYPLYLSSDWNGKANQIASHTLTKEQYDAAVSTYQTALDAYDDALEDFKATLDAVYETTDDYLVFKNYLNANIDAYKDRLGNVGKDVFAKYLADLDVNNVDSRTEYYDAIRKLEEALDAAEVADAKAEALDKIEEGDLDFTGAIYNPSFELGDLYADDKARGWTVAAGYPSTFIVANADDVYKTDGVDGARLFNNWWTGTHLTQTITDLPAGTYVLSALIASGDGVYDEGGKPIDYNDATVYLTTGEGEENRRGVNPPRYGKKFGDYSKKLVVPNEKDGKGTATIGVIGGNDNDHTDENPGPIGTFNEFGHWWYKCDNFRLEYLPNGILPLKDEDVKIKNLIDPFDGVNVTRSISFGNWSTLVLPFDMPKPSDWEIETLTEVSQYNGDIKLVFGTPTEAEGGGSVLKAGVPYIVRVKSQVTAIEAENVDVNTTLKLPGLKESGEYTVEFVPVYVQGYVPASAIEKDADGNPVLGEDGNAIAAVGPQYYFLSGGKLKRCIYENSNKIKGFRGYFKVTPATQAAAKKLRTIGMQTSEETDIENVANEEVTVVGIYNVNGVKLDSMQPGINILRMNNGTTKKVMVK